MIATRPTTALVQRHTYVADWFEIKDVELDLINTNYTLSYRFGPSWFLEAQRHDGQNWIDVQWPGRERCFRLQDPAAAIVALGDRITNFACISTGMKFNSALAKVLARAEDIKATVAQS
uniref:Uncharacterized protein n=1 Tax=Pseudomonas phage Touem01 TaxID=3138548 RepID=A0AAU6W2A7_9VIRU